MVCEAENEKQAESWFFDFFQRHNQQTSPRLMLGIDDLGVVKDDQPVQELSEAAFLATARELKATRLCRRRNVTWINRNQALSTMKCLVTS